MNNNNNNHQNPPRAPPLHPREEMHLAIMATAGPILHRLSAAVDALLHHHATAREHAFPNHLKNELAEAVAEWENHFLHVRAEPRGAFDPVLGRARMNYDTLPRDRWEWGLAPGVDVRIAGAYGEDGRAADGTVVGIVPADNRCYFVALDPLTISGDSPEVRRRVVVPANLMEIYW